MKSTVWRNIKVCNICGNTWPSNKKRPTMCSRRLCHSALWDQEYNDLTGERANYKRRLDAAFADYERLQAEHTAALSPSDL